MKRRFPWALVAMLFLAPTAYPASWSPDLRFQIEGISQSEALIFISGLAYGLSYTAARLAHDGKRNFYCLPSGKTVDSKLLVELLNQRLVGSQAAERVTSVTVVGLAENFPCK